MSDISLCYGTNCPVKEQCLRFTQPPRPIWQSYLCMQVSIKEIDKCKYFIDNEEKELDTKA